MHNARHTADNNEQKQNCRKKTHIRYSLKTGFQYRYHAVFSTAWQLSCAAIVYPNLADYFSFINNPVVGNSTAIFELFCFVISVSVAAIYLIFIF
ncbi:hypothetical protein ACPSXS_24210 [Escherichia coli]|uniref:hypothetical protein n=1 Tax=Escherichia coli TaxID=562 RepID=UPI003CF563ED